MAEYIEREKLIDAIEGINWYKYNDEGRLTQGGTSHDKMFLPYSAVEGTIKTIPAADVRPVPDGGIGEMSDGYHTFNGLYYQRMVLFAALVKAYKDKAWKSLRHEDGELCFGGGWFIVGIDTPQGSYTYHYEDKDWNRFDCVELPVAKHWDGHTEEDVTRLLSLDVRPVVLCGVCELHGHCYAEDVFAFARLAEENRFCAVGKVKTNGKKKEES